MPAAARKIILKDSSIKALKPAPSGRRDTVWDALMPNLAVRITDKGKRSFYVVKRRAGDVSPTWHLLGAYPVMGLGQAREAAREVLTALMAGQHPKRLAEEKRQAIEAKAREAAENSFAAVAEAFARQYLPRIRSAKTYEAYLRREFIPVLGTQPIAEIRRRDVVSLLEGIAARSGAPAARVALAVLRKCMNWALSRDLPGYEANPASALNAGDILGSAKARDRLLSDAEIALIWPAIEAVSEPFRTVYKLLALTGARYREIADAQWDDLDLDAATLTVRSDRSKTGAAMLIPLPPSAVALFAETPRFSGPYIFTTTAGSRPAGGLSRAKKQLDAALGTTVAPFVIHDLRRAVRSGLGRLGVPTVVAELVLGHKQPGIAGVYDRHSYLDEKRDALLRWERHLMTIIEPPDPEKIVTLSAARARA
jgi:integrase